MQLVEEELISCTSDAHNNTGGLTDNISANSGEHIISSGSGGNKRSSEMSDMSPTPSQQEVISPPPPTRNKKSAMNVNNGQALNGKIKKSVNTTPECSVTISENADFDPYEIVENIADLTVEQLKVSLLGEPTGKEDNFSNNGVVIENLVPETPPRTKSKKLETPPRRKHKTRPDSQNSNISESSSNASVSVNTNANDDSSSITSSTSSRKKCRLRVVSPNKELKKKEDVTVEIKDEKISTKDDPNLSRMTGSTALNGHNSNSLVNRDENSQNLAQKLSNEDKCVTTTNKKKSESVKIPINKSLTKLETVKSPAINDNNGQLCRQTQGKCWDSTNIYFKVKIFSRYSEDRQGDRVVSGGFDSISSRIFDI